MGLFGTLAGIFGGGSQKKAAQKATDAMIAAYNRGIDTQNAFNQQVRQDYMPYTEAGTSAVEQLASLVNGDLSPEQLTALIKGNPLYEATYRNGEEALLQNAAATGGLRGGNTQRGLADFGADTLARVYGTIKNDLSGLAGLGLGAQGTVTQAGSNVTDNVTSLLENIGGAQANNFLAKGRINAQNWSNIGGFLDDAINSILPTNMLGLSKAATSRLNPAAQSVISSNPKIF